jgi:hypothetical protein
LREAKGSDNWLKVNQLLAGESCVWREAAKDEKMAWHQELGEEKLTPGRVLRSLALNLAEVGEFSPEVLPRGKSSGWEKGQVRKHPPKYKIKLKGKKKPKSVEQVE